MAMLRRNTFAKELPMSRTSTSPLVSAVAATVALLGTSAAYAQAAPVVQGPEAVADWYDAGTAFIAQGKQLASNTRRAKNVILFVGDGMGISTITAARILEGQLKGKPGEENKLSFDAFPYTALSKTYSWDQQTSDSAPTMTAMSTGYKTREGMLSVTTPRRAASAMRARSTARKSRRSSSTRPRWANLPASCPPPA
jgi:alkaline phosphatase